MTIGNAACTSTYLRGNVVLLGTTNDDASSAVNKQYVDDTFEPKITGVTADVVIDGSTYSFTNGILCKSTLVIFVQFL